MFQCSLLLNECDLALFWAKDSLTDFPSKTAVMLTLRSHDLFVQADTRVVYTGWYCRILKRQPVTATGLDPEGMTECQTMGLVIAVQPDFIAYRIAGSRDILGDGWTDEESSRP